MAKIAQVDAALVQLSGYTETVQLIDLDDVQ